MKTCLIVDESSVVRKVAARIVFQLGFEVDAQPCVADAQPVIAKDGLPSLLIVAATTASADEVLAFVRACRARPDARSASILALLVEANLGLMTRLKRAGVDGFLFKPFTRAEMAAGLSPFIGAVASEAA
ncbi:response regulator [Antarcticirhabdus aurantiaca]|uniref:Response regulator n=1 Tax=Antarcticirhabdus aurantiaca TaxID=2606717 RepID=A0ACD4NJR7_9HYPH|nr:response regulator [Antarcticirhabdus aurantiaca]WAJ27035.1 response regulator [Jeongeuplla avenae]